MPGPMCEFNKSQIPTQSVEYRIRFRLNKRGKIIWFSLMRSAKNSSSIALCQPSLTYSTRGFFISLTIAKLQDPLGCCYWFIVTINWFRKWSVTFVFEVQIGIHNLMKWNIYSVKGQVTQSQQKNGPTILIVWSNFCKFFPATPICFTADAELLNW